MTTHYYLSQQPVSFVTSAIIHEYFVMLLLPLMSVPSRRMQALFRQESGTVAVAQNELTLGKSCHLPVILPYGILISTSHLHSSCSLTPTTFTRLFIHLIPTVP